jgi:FG-GAP-like repeat
VNVLLQNADGTMAAPVSYSTNTNDALDGVAVGDSNGDGRADVVVGHGVSPSLIARLLQNAQGSLAAPVTYPSTVRPGPIVIADMDADGRKDVLALHTGTVGVGLYRQTAAGDLKVWPNEFGPSSAEQLYPLPFSSGYGPQALAVGDVNGDGLRDAVVASGSNGLVVLPHTTDLEPTVTVTAPAPGTYFTGQPLVISWTGSSDAGYFAPGVSFDGGATYATMPGCTAAQLQQPAYTCTWTQPGPAATGVRIRVTALDVGHNEGYGETTFNLAAPTVTVTAPARNSTVYVGTSATIAWSTNLSPSTTMRIELSRDLGATYTTLDAAAPNTGSYAWTVSGPASLPGLVRVSANGPVTASGTSGGFVIAPAPSLTVTAPAAGSTVFVSSPLTVTWTSQNLPSGTNVRIELTRDGGATYQMVAPSVAASTGSFSSFAAFAPTTNAMVRVTAIGSAPATATSGVFSIVLATLNVTGPAPGTTAFAGTSLPITWTTNAPAATIKIELSRDGGSTYTILAPSAPNTGSFAWPIAGPDTANAGLRLTATGSAGAFGFSGTFAIVTPAVAVTAPAANATLFAGTPATISWSHNMPGIATALIELSRDGGASFEMLAAAAPNTGSFVWTATGPDSGALVRVTLNGPPFVSGASGAFAVVTPALSVTGPTAGTTWYAGSAQTIAWSSNLPTSATVLIELSRDGGGTFETLAAAAPNTGTFAWLVTGPNAGAAIVRVSCTDPASATGASGGFAIVTPVLAVTAPTAGASWTIGSAQTITWTSNLSPADTVRVDLSRDAGGTYTTLAATAPNTGSFAWTATGAASSAALVRVTWNGPAPASAVSGNFAIANATMAVTSPAAAASWTIGTARTITWTTNLPASGTVKIELSRNGGTSYSALAASAANSGSFAWTATGAATTNAIVRVSFNGTPAASAVSGTFSLVAAAVTVTSPNTLVTWLVGSVHAITWTHNVGTTAQFTIEVSRNSGSTWTLITATAPASGGTSGSFNWTVASPRADTCRIRVTWTGNSAVNDASNTNFRIR